MLLSKYTTYLSTLESPMSSEKLWRLQEAPATSVLGQEPTGIPWVWRRVFTLRLAVPASDKS